jgi:hypothetical protein
MASKTNRKESDGIGDLSRQFLLAEFQALRREIEQELRELESYTPYSLFASAAIWTWLLSDKGQFASKLVCWFPALLTVLFFVENVTVLGDMEHIGAYIAKIEDALQLPQDLGWERNLRRGHYKFKHNTWRYIFWTFLLVAIVTGAIVYTLFWH